MKRGLGAIFLLLILPVSSHASSPQKGERAIGQLRKAQNARHK